ncbi:MAG: hypothetical protein ACSLE1_17265 [Sphingobium sp.]
MEFSRYAMAGAAIVLEGPDNPLRLDLFAVSIRIFPDHMMDALAPRDQVEACRWFAFEDSQGHPTRRQRLAYGLHGGFTPDQFVDLSWFDADELVGAVVRGVSRPLGCEARASNRQGARRVAPKPGTPLLSRGVDASDQGAMRRSLRVEATVTAETENGG